MQTHPLHEQALSLISRRGQRVPIHGPLPRLAKTYRETEAKLFELISQIDEQKIWRALGYGSLWEYATRSLGLAESTAYALIAVSRKSREIPALKTAVVDGGTSVSKLRRVLPVLTKANQTEWIQKARELPKRQLEAEVGSCAGYKICCQKNSGARPHSKRRLGSWSTHVLKKMTLCSRLNGQKCAGWKRLRKKLLARAKSQVP